MSEKWFAIMIVGVMFSGALMIWAMNSGSNHYTPPENNSQRKDRYAHEEKMLILQKDTMPKDSIIVIQGNKYKLEKYE